MESKLNTVEGIDKVKSLKLLLLNWVWVSQDWARKKEGKVKADD